MQVHIKNSSWKVHEYKTLGACAFDFESSEDVVFAPGEWRLVETGTVIATPEGYCLVIAPRSSIFKNYGLMQVNSIKKWERIGQGMFVKIEKPEFVLVEKMGDKNRGGFGTTGIN